MSPPFEDWATFFAYLQAAVHQNHSPVVVIDGDRRSGKSTLGRGICKRLHKDYDAGKDPLFDQNDLATRLTRPHKREIFLLDEGGNVMSSYDWNTTFSKRMTRIINMTGKFNDILIWVWPYIEGLNINVRDRWATVWLHVYEQGFDRGFVNAFWRTSNPRTRSRWWELVPGMDPARFGPTRAWGITKSEEEEYERRKDRAIVAASAPPPPKSGKLASCPDCGQPTVRPDGLCGFCGWKAVETTLSLDPPRGK